MLHATNQTSRSLRIAIVMDPITSIKPAKDSTLAMMLAAQKRGHHLFYLQQGDLWLRDGMAWGRVCPIEVMDSHNQWATLGDARPERLDQMDVVLMRKDPPFDMEYIYTTYILERAEAAGVLVLNKPAGLRDMNEKVYTAWFAHCCAPTLITRNMQDMHTFLQEHEQIVCKPLHGMGGRSIFVVNQSDKNASVIFETMTNYGQQFAIVQKYLPEIVETGDSRILIIDGQPAPYALARIPATTDHRGNLAAGAQGKGRELNDRDRWLVSQIGPALLDKGMLFVGLDVIGGFVTEINVTSPTGIRELDKQFNCDIASFFISAIEKRFA